MYTIVWRYTIKPGSKDIFETQYGPNGVWNKLFKKSDNYNGSFLHVNDNDPLSYLLVDTWTDKNSYENFMRINRTDYTNQSEELEYLYEKEELIGNYFSID